MKCVAVEGIKNDNMNMINKTNANSMGEYGVYEVLAKDIGNCVMAYKEA